MDEESRLKLRSDLQKTKNQIISLQQQADKGVDLKSKKGTNNLEDMAKSAKKFMLSLISIRGVYALLSKASQSYMATDEKTTNQMEANWIGLGTILKPAIDLIVNLFKKAVTSILYFMSVLTGVNYIEKANTAILKKQTEATNDLTKANDKLNASFDEMNVLQAPSSSSAESSVDTSALFDINDIGESAKNTIEKLGKALKPVYEKIKDIVKWAIENPETILGILGGVSLLTMLGKIIGFAGTGVSVGSGLAGVLGVLLAIASVGVITISIVAIYKSVKEAQKSFESLEGIAEGLRETIQENTVAFEEYNKTADWTTEGNKNLKNIFFELAKSSQESTNKIKEERDEMGVLEYTINHLSGAWESNNEVIKTNNEMMYENIKKLFQLYEQGDLTQEEIEELKSIMENFTETIEEADSQVGGLSSAFGLNQEEADRLKEKYKEVKTNLQKISGQTNDTREKIGALTGSLANIKTDVNIRVNADTTQAKNTINSLFYGLERSVAVAFGAASVTIPKLAVGGIINNPGHGVPLGSAIGGEVSKEGVIPLTDSQAMEELGQTIGKYININLTNITQLNNRQIAREQKKINAQNDFAMNK